MLGSPPQLKKTGKGRKSKAILRDVKRRAAQVHEAAGNLETPQRDDEEEEVAPPILPPNRLRSSAGFEGAVF